MLLSIVVTFSGIVNETKLEQYEKALEQSETTLGGISTLSKLSHDSNEFRPMYVTFSGIFTDFIL